MTPPIVYHWWADCNGWPIESNDGEGHRLAQSRDQVTCAVCRADADVRGYVDDGDDDAQQPR